MPQQQVLITGFRTNAFDNDVSTADTIAKMRDIARGYSSSFPVSSATNAALSRLQDDSSIPQVRTIDLARVIFYWVKGHVRFVEDDATMQAWGIDPSAMGGRDLLITPPMLLSMSDPIGDCDDFSTLLASMMICAGFIRSFGKGWFVTIAGDRNNPTMFTHVYTKWELPEGNPMYLYMDASHGAFPGWETSSIYRKQEWEI